MYRFSPSPAVGAARVSGFGSSDEAPATYAIRVDRRLPRHRAGRKYSDHVQTIADGITRPLR